MNILLLGANGQLGWELKRSAPFDFEITTCDFPKVDFTSSSSLQNCIQSAKPECIINVAAYTAVDEAEENQELAYRINHIAVEEIVETCEQNDIFLVHISTDFIFNGNSCKPYSLEDKPDPISVYGLSKLKGEEAVKKLPDKNHLIIRTAWLYSSHGTNFVKTMLSMMKEKENLSVIDEQIGTPTWAFGLAEAIWMAVQKQLTGIYHWTDAGVASWYDFAVSIQEEALNIGILEKTIPIYPVKSKVYQTLAERPFYSVLDKELFWKDLNIHPEHWRSQLRKMLKDLE